MLIQFNKDDILATMKFMSKTELKGSEVPIFNQIITKLQNPVDNKYKLVDTIDKIVDNNDTNIKISSK